MLLFIAVVLCTSVIATCIDLILVYELGKGASLLLDNTSIPTENWYYNAEECANHTLYDKRLLVESFNQTRCLHRDD